MTRVVLEIAHQDGKDAALAVLERLPSSKDGDIAKIALHSQSDTEIFHALPYCDRYLDSAPLSFSGSGKEKQIAMRKS